MDKSIRIIPIASLTDRLSTVDVERDYSASLLDGMHRPLRDLRISVTDRCNLRCTYCMPREVFDQHYAFLAARRVAQL